MIAHGEPYHLEKPVWTEADFDQMGWHDSQVHGLSFQSDEYRVLFDIDYIYAWVEPAPGKKGYSFWVSPCTLVFDNVSNLKISLNSEVVEILDIQRRDERRTPNGRFAEWTWEIECDNGSIVFDATGYTQFTRVLPRHTPFQSLAIALRGGVKFDEPVIALD